MHLFDNSFFSTQRGSRKTINILAIENIIISGDAVLIANGYVYPAV